jgi:hypothetical protein
LVLDQFFNGELTTHGILENSCGEIIRYFNVTINRSLDDQGVGTLAEKFIFNDENRQFRTWTFTPPVTTTDGIQYRVPPMIYLQQR